MSLYLTVESLSAYDDYLFLKLGMESGAITSAQLSTSGELKTELDGSVVYSFTKDGGR